MKYLWTLTVVIVSVGLMAGAAVAQDSFAVVYDWDEDEEVRVPRVDLPDALAWDAVYDSSVEVVNDGSTTWTVAGYDLRSVEGSTLTSVSAVDRWVTTAVPLLADVESVTGAVAPNANVFNFSVTAPPIIGTFECDWVMANGGAPFLTDLAEADVTLNRFADIAPGSAGEWAASDIEACAGRVPPIVLGFPDGFYRPALTITRDAMAVYMRRGAGLTPLNPAEPTFPDVDAGFWAYQDIEACADAGIVLGYGDGSYQPALAVTRAQMAVYVARAANLTFDPDVDPEEDPFPDVPIGFWADNEIEACVDAGIVQGYTDGLYRPTAFVDRAQMAVYATNAFITATNVAVVNGGPDVTNINPAAATYHGWSGAAQNPVNCYVLFDPARLGTGLAAGGNNLWDIRFDFRTVDKPTVTVALATVQFTQGEIAAASGDYFVAYTAVPVSLLTDNYLMVTSVEDASGTMQESGRVVEFNVTLPPPPPGPEGPFPACDQADDLWSAVADPSGRASIAAGSFLNVAESDDLYLVLSIPPLAPHSTNWNDSSVAWDLCCWPDPNPLGVPDGMGAAIKWCDIEIPTGATEMVVTFEYRADIADYYCCSSNPCANDGQAWHGMGEPWDSEQAPLGWGMGMVDWVGDPWTLSTWGSEADLFNSHDNPGGFTDNEYARKSRSEETVVWTLPIARAPDYVDVSGNVVLQMCGGGWAQMYIDQAIIEFTIP
jgi:hypothetical protein